jgi:hypothetical protein
MKYFFLASIVLGFLLGCKGDKKEESIDPNLVSEEVNFVRYDQMIFDNNSPSLEYLDSIISAHPIFSQIYLNRILGFPVDSSKEFLQKMLSSNSLKRLYDTTQVVLNNWPELKHQISNALKRYKYLLPERDIPTVYTVISEFSIANFVFSDQNGTDAVGIGLDMFLGRNFPYTEMFPSEDAFSRYLTLYFDSKYMERKVIFSLIDDLLGSDPGPKLIDNIIHNGKKLYLLDRCLEVPDSILYGYTKEQLNWCRENEFNIWEFFIAENLLYSTNLMKIGKYTDPSPTSSGMPSSSPGRTGAWIGHQIVKQYMIRNSSINISDLLNNRDSQEILEKSKFKPK